MNIDKMRESGQWWTNSLNASIGCTKIVDGCKHCYAETMAKRLLEMCLANNTNPEYLGVVDENGWTGKVELCEHRLDKPLHWKKPRIVFVDSMSDLFHEQVPFEFIDKVMAVIRGSPQHIFLLLTKRLKQLQKYAETYSEFYHGKMTFTENAKNLWLGCTPTKPEDIATLLEIPAAHRFISLEPMLEKWDIRPYLPKRIYGNRTEAFVDGKLVPVVDGIDLCFVGAETGPHARYCPIEWIEDVVKQCKVARAKVWVKAVHLWELGDKLYRTQQEAKLHNGEGNPKMKIVHKFNELPESVRIRQSPFITGEPMVK